MAHKLPPQLVASVGAALLVALTVIAAQDGRPERVEVDVPAYNRAIDALRDAGLGGQATDILTRPVAPGETIVTGVSLPPGMRYVPDSLVLSGPAAARFSNISITETARDDGDTWLEIRATNTWQRPVRLTALLTYEPGAPAPFVDAGPTE